MFQFYCPQGHVLQGDPSQVGQPYQCPYCGVNFLVPPLDPATAAAYGFSPAPGPYAMPPMSPMGPPPEMIMPEPPDEPPAEPPPEQPAASEPTADAPKFVLPFSTEKASLPFELPDMAAGPLKPVGGGSFLDGPAQVAPSSEPAEPSERVARLPDVEEPKAPAAQILHFRCPAGHMLQIGNDKLGQMIRCPVCKKQFDVRYENTVEFARKKAKIQQRQADKSGQAWLAWALLVGFFVLIGLVALLIKLF